MFSSCLGKSVIWAFLKWKSGDGPSCRTSFSDWAVPLPAGGLPQTHLIRDTLRSSLSRSFSWRLGLHPLTLSVLPCLHLPIARCRSIPCHPLRVCLGRGGHVSLLPLSMTALAQVLGCSSPGLLAAAPGRSPQPVTFLPRQPPVPSKPRLKSCLEGHQALLCFPMGLQGLMRELLPSFHPRAAVAVGGVGWRPESPLRSAEDVWLRCESQMA